MMGRIAIFMFLLGLAMPAFATEQSLRPGGVAIIEVGSIDNEHG